VSLDEVGLDEVGPGRSGSWTKWVLDEVGLDEVGLDEVSLDEVGGPILKYHKFYTKISKSKIQPFQIKKIKIFSPKMTKNQTNPCLLAVSI
jgi:hypothetical protein